ncbi:MAG TPA: hypothetical protein VGN01_17110 [Acidobacteriaceae bacterium]|jgi:hypothetical protein
MTVPEIDDRDNDDPIVLGSPEGDGDFESDGLPETGETSAGGQPKPRKDLDLSGRTHWTEKELDTVTDQISRGMLWP